MVGNYDLHSDMLLWGGPPDFAVQLMSGWIEGIKLLGLNAWAVIVLYVCIIGAKPHTSELNENFCLSVIVRTLWVWHRRGFAPPCFNMTLLL